MLGAHPFAAFEKGWEGRNPEHAYNHPDTTSKGNESCGEGVGQPAEDSQPVKRVLAWGDAVFFVGFAAFIASRVHWNLRVWIGMAVAAAGFALWLTARVQLGSSFSARAQARTLVTTGLYARLSHPIYLFGFIAYAGVFLIWGRWIPFLCFLLINSIQVVRLRKEERVLEEAFGEEYRQYKARTWL